MGLIDESFAECGMKPLGAVMDYISEDGVVGQVSYGTPMGREEKQFYKDIEDVYKRQVLDCPGLKRFSWTLIGQPSIIKFGKEIRMAGKKKGGAALPPRRKKGLSLIHI